MIFKILVALWEDPVGGFVMKLGIAASIWNVIYFFTFRRWNKEIREKKEKEWMRELHEDEH
jgi:hypothetical protein